MELYWVMQSIKPTLFSATLHCTWVGRDEYKLVITYYETPFTIKYLSKFNGDILTITFDFNVVFSGDKTFVVNGRVNG